MEYWTDFIFQIHVDEILRCEGVTPSDAHSRRPALVEAAQQVSQMGISKIHPGVVLKESGIREHRNHGIVLENGTLLTSSCVANSFAGAESVVVAVCTIGPELEQLSSDTLKESPLLALAYDGLGTAAVYAIRDQVCSRLEGRANSRGLKISSPLSPGDPDWPVKTGQSEIFSLLDADRISVKLTESGMMHPKKSLSFVVGIGKNMEQVDLCAVCSMRDRCRHRHD